MEQEINLREYVAVLLCWKWWIAGLAVIAAILALVVSFFLPPTFEAAALVAVTQPRYTMRFDPRFETSNNVQPVYKAYPELAASDALLKDLFTQLSPLPEGVETQHDLRGIVTAETGGDPSTVHLIARFGDPQETARIVNLWAELFVDRANEVYGAQNQGQVQFFEEQLTQTRESLEAAEQALVTFQARNQQAILEAKLLSAQRDQAVYLAEQRALDRLVQSVKELRTQLATRASEAEVTLGDELAVLRLRLKAFDLADANEGLAAVPPKSTSPSVLVVTGRSQEFGAIQLQVKENATLSGRTVTDLIALLDALEQSLERQAQENESQLAAIEPQILALQKEEQEVSNEADRLTRARSLARETYVTLARKVDETRIAVQDTSGAVKLASGAVVPEDAVSPRKSLNTVVAGALGLMLGVFGAFAIEWWRGERPALTPTEKPS
jgi:uncharacterized protein involved in exopolysaccharide biosynthesis